MENVNFWDLGGYKKVLEELRRGQGSCELFVRMVQERAEIEERYARSLEAWRERWLENNDNGREIGGTVVGWNACLEEASLVSKIHRECEERIIGTGGPAENMKAWVQKHFKHTDKMGLDLVDRLGEEFKAASEEYTREYGRAMKTREAYHKISDDAQKARKFAKEEEVETVVNDATKKRLFSRADKLTIQENYVRRVYKRRVEACQGELKDRYKEGLEDVLKRCCDIESARLHCMKNQMLTFITLVDMSSTFKSSLESCRHSYEVTAATTPTADVDLWLQQFITSEFIQLPVFEEFFPEEEVDYETVEEMQKPVQRPSASFFKMSLFGSSDEESSESESESSSSTSSASVSPSASDVSVPTNVSSLPDDSIKSATTPPRREQERTRANLEKTLQGRLTQRQPQRQTKATLPFATQTYNRTTSMARTVQVPRSSQTASTTAERKQHSRDHPENRPTTLQLSVKERERERKTFEKSQRDIEASTDSTGFSVSSSSASEKDKLEKGATSPSSDKSPRQSVSLESNREERVVMAPKSPKATVTETVYNERSNGEIREILIPETVTAAVRLYFQKQYALAYERGRASCKTQSTSTDEETTGGLMGSRNEGSFGFVAVSDSKQEGKSAMQPAMEGETEIPREISEVIDTYFQDQEIKRKEQDNELETSLPSHKPVKPNIRDSVEDQTTEAHFGSSTPEDSFTHHEQLDSHLHETRDDVKQPTFYKNVKWSPVKPPVLPPVRTTDRNDPPYHDKSVYDQDGEDESAAGAHYDTRESTQPHIECPSDLEPESEPAAEDDAISKAEPSAQRRTDRPHSPPPPLPVDRFSQFVHGGVPRDGHVGSMQDKCLAQWFIEKYPEYGRLQERMWEYLQRSNPTRYQEALHDAKYLMVLVGDRSRSQAPVGQNKNPHLCHSPHICRHCLQKEGSCHWSCHSELTCASSRRDFRPSSARPARQRQSHNREESIDRLCREAATRILQLPQENNGTINGMEDVAGSSGRVCGARTDSEHMCKVATGLILDRDGFESRKEGRKCTYGNTLPFKRGQGSSRCGHSDRFGQPDQDASFVSVGTDFSSDITETLESKMKASDDASTPQEERKLTELQAMEQLRPGDGEYLVRALYNFSPANWDELRIVAGQYLVQVGDESINGWVMARAQTQQGLIPASYVKLIKT